MEVTVKCKEVCKYYDPDLKGSILECCGHISITIDNIPLSVPMNTRERMILPQNRKQNPMLISFIDWCVKEGMKVIFCAAAKKEKGKFQTGTYKLKFKVTDYIHEA